MAYKGWKIWKRGTLMAMCFVVLLTAASCRHQSKMSSGRKTKTEKSEKENRPSTAKSTETVEPTLQREYTVIHFTGAAEGISFSGQMRLAQDSIIWVSVSKVMELGRAIATPDSVAGYSQLLGKNFNGTYADVNRSTKVKTTFTELQTMANADDAEARIAELASKLGFNVKIKITRREKVTAVSFPFKDSR